MLFRILVHFGIGAVKNIILTMADLYTPFRNYVKKMLTFQGREKGTAKVLILDNDTVGFVWIGAWLRLDTVDFCSVFTK